MDGILKASYGDHGQREANNRQRDLPAAGRVQENVAARRAANLPLEVTEVVNKVSQSVRQAGLTHHQDLLLPYPAIPCSLLSGLPTNPAVGADCTLLGLRIAQVPTPPRAGGPLFWNEKNQGGTLHDARFPQPSSPVPPLSQRKTQLLTSWTLIPKQFHTFAFPIRNPKPSMHRCHPSLSHLHSCPPPTVPSDPVTSRSRSL